MSIPMSSWLTHASREPSSAVVAGLGEWAETAVRHARLSGQGCAFLGDAARAAIVAHTDRALHKRRQRPTFLTSVECTLPNAAGHGLRPMSTLVADDCYGPEDLLVEHVVGSALAEAILSANGGNRSAVVPIVTEAEVLDEDTFHLHHSRQIDARDSGVVLPFMIVNAESTQITEAEDREALLRAAGWTSYTFAADWDSLTEDDHVRLALLLEDVVDEIVQIKADADARVLSGPPLWPLVEIHSA